jgi:hypothetical protein
MTILFSFNELENKSKCPSRTRGYLKPRWANYTPKGDVRRWRGASVGSVKFFDLHVQTRCRWSSSRRKHQHQALSDKPSNQR